MANVAGTFVSRCVKHVLAVVVCALICLTVQKYHATIPISSAAEQATKDLALPQPGIVSFGDLLPGVVRRYQINVQSRWYLQAFIEVYGTRSSIRVYGPDGNAIVQLECRENGELPISFVADNGGSYRLEITAEGTNGHGRYRLTIDENRRTTDKDHERIVAATEFSSADRLLGEWKAAALQEAIEGLKKSVAVSRTANDLNLLTRALSRIGDVHQILGETKAALPYYLKALTLNRLTQPAQAELMNEIGYLYLTQGDNLKALGFFSKAHRVSRSIGDPRAIAQSLEKLGEVSYELGKLQESLTYFQQAIPHWHESRDRQGEAQTLLYFGYTYSDLGEMDNSLHYYKQALELCRASSNNRGLAITLTAIGRLYSRTGESQLALNYFDQAMQIIQPLGARAEEGRILTGIGYVYGQMGERDKAIDYYSQAYELFHANGDYSGEVAALYDTGIMNHSLGNYQKALECFQQALSNSLAAHDLRLQAFELREIGRVHDALGDNRKALDNYFKALRFWKSEADSRASAETLSLIGGISEEEGSKSKAVDYYQQALVLSRKAQFRAGEAASLYNLARLKRDNGDLDEAREKIEEALRVVESLRTKVSSQELRASYFASVRQHYDLYIDVLMSLHKQHPERGFAVEAFEVSERARARSLLELLEEARADIRQGVDRSLLEKELELQKELDTLADKELRQVNEGNQSAEATRKEIDRLTADLEYVRTQIRERSPRYAELSQVTPIQLSQIQTQILDENTVLLEYALGDDRSYLWKITRSKVSAYALPPRTEIEKAVRRFHDMLTANQPKPGESYQQHVERVAQANGQLRQETELLSKLLLSPVAAELAANNRRLLIVADGALQFIPFQVLTFDDQKFARAGSSADLPQAETQLITTHEIVNEPSASALALLMSTNEDTDKRPNNTLAIFADPVFEADDPRIRSRVAGPVAESSDTKDVQRSFRDVDASLTARIPRLPASRDEAESVLAMVPGQSSLKALGFDASRASVTQANLGNYKIIHFATHGLLNNEHPELSGIVLSLFNERGEPQPGFLRLYDIYNLKLRADLVVLSACNTGLGKEIRGEGLIGLTRGFMYAGASSVVASLWKVDDDATAELMKHFYRGMFENRLTPAAALREAQLALRKQKRWHEPYYWAGFILQGRHNQAMKVPPSSLERSVVLLVLVLAGASAALFFLLRRRLSF